MRGRFNLRSRKSPLKSTRCFLVITVASMIMASSAGRRTSNYNYDTLEKYAKWLKETPIGPARGKKPKQIVANGVTATFSGYKTDYAKYVHSLGHHQLYHENGDEMVPSKYDERYIGSMIDRLECSILAIVANPNFNVNDLHIRQEHPQECKTAKVRIRVQRSPEIWFLQFRYKSGRHLASIQCCSD